MRIAANIIEVFGRRLENFGYALANPRYFDVRRNGGSRDLFRLLNRPWLPKKVITAVVDVGANEGQFIRVAQALLPDAAIYAFEPLPQAADRLEGTDWGKTSVRVLRTALGAEPGRQPLNVSAFTPASSLLTPTDLQVESFPASAVAGVVEVEVDKLDRWLPEFASQEGELLIKLDVQGFEDRVLKGAAETLKRTAVVVTEVNLQEFYEGQCRFEDILRLMDEAGFKLTDMGGFIRDKTDEIIYMDVAFKRVS